MANPKTLASDFVQMIKVLAKRLQCCIIILHHIDAKELTADNSKKQFDKFWNPVIDLRLYFSEKTDMSNRVEVIKSWHLVNHSTKILLFLGIRANYTRLHLIGRSKFMLYSVTLKLERAKGKKYPLPMDIPQHFSFIIFD